MLLLNMVDLIKLFCYVILRLQSNIIHIFKYQKVIQLHEYNVTFKFKIILFHNLCKKCDWDYILLKTLLLLNKYLVTTMKNLSNYYS